jgi:4-amino-4-deoxy-L-arabinose transferase-like glycosyltransferase
MTQLTKHRSAIALVAILCIAFGLRFWSIGWGMPFAFHGDEPKYLRRAVTMLGGDLNPHYFENPPLLTYLMFLQNLLLFLAGKLLGIYQSAEDVVREFYFSPTRFYVLARLISVVLGTGTVLLTYVVGRRFVGVNGGLLAALLLAVVFLHVRDSHYAVNDVTATFLLMVSFYFAVRIYMAGEPDPGRQSWNQAAHADKPATAMKSPPGHLADYLLGGAFLGLAVAAKYNVGLGAAALVAAHLLSCRDLWKRPSVTAHLPLIGAGVASLLAFIVGNPYSILDFSAFRAEFLSQYGWAADPYRQSDVPVAQLMLRALTVGTSPIIVGVSALGLVLMALRQPRKAVLLASFPFAYTAFFLLDSDFFPARFAIPLLPFLVIAAAYGTGMLVVMIPSGAWRRAAMTLAIGLLVIPSLVQDVRHNTLLRAEDTRLLLGRWVEENVPAGSKIALEGYTYIDVEGRPLGLSRLPYRQEVNSSLRQQPLEHYVRENVNYLIVSSFVYGRYDLAPDRHHQAIEWYQRLDDELPLVAAFYPTSDGRDVPFIMDEEITPIYTLFERDRPGPTLKVYRIGPPPPPALYRVEWADSPVPPRMSPGQTSTVQVTARNTGNVYWPSGGIMPVRVGHRWLNAVGQMVDEAQQRVSLPGDVPPDAEFTVQVELVAPAEPGRYTLQLELIQENFAWLSTQGAETKDFTVDTISP